MSVTMLNQFAIDLLTAFGIDPNDVRSFTLNATAGCLPVLEVTFCVFDSPASGELAEIVKRYELKPKDEG